MALFLCYLTFWFLFTRTAHRKTNRFYLTFCGHVHLNNQQRSQHYFTWHFVFIFTWTALRKTNIISVTFCGRVHFNSQQRNWHILLDILWSCYLNHLQINQHISRHILSLYSLELPTEKTTYFTQHFVVMLLEQASEKSTYFTWHFVYMFA